MDRTPLVSVVIPTYNQPALLLETLASVFAQTFTDYEVVVIDDGSTDDTLARLQPLHDRHGDRLRIITQPNAGIGAARNRGIDEARGVYVAPLDHDDLWMPGKLAAQVRFMEANPAAAACSVPWAFSTAPGSCAFDLAAARDAAGIVRRPLDRIARNEVIAMTSALLFRRAAVAGLRYDPVRGSLEDLAFLILLFSRGEFGIAGDEILVVYRIHAGNSSSGILRYYHGTLSLRRQHAAGGFDALSGPHRADLRRYMAFLGRLSSVQLLRHGYRRQAAAVYAREVRHQLRVGQVRFLAMFPPLLAAPHSVLKRLWGGTERGQPARPAK